MRIRIFTLYSFPCVVAITISMAAHQSLPSGTAAFQSESSKEAIIFTGQIVNRAGKTDLLPVKRAQPSANDKAPVRTPAHCKPPIDVLGRCFASFRADQTAA
jgi:hypothetical protein